MNTILTGVAVILLGYSSFAMIVVRSMANPTMDQNSPEDVFSLMSYLNREQYGNRPLFSGEYYNSPLDWDAMEGDQGRPVYIKKDNKYEIVDYRPSYKFDDRTTTLFPRMYSREERHIQEYQRWANIKGRTMTTTDDSGRSQNIQLPTFSENITFFFNYQVRHMYFRYFMWNFAGRQNDIQGHGEIHKGNWISGIPFLDNLMYGDQDLLPDSYKNNPARNKYYLLPLLLGVLGLAFQSGSNLKGKRDFWVVMLLFFFTGLAIVLYLNQTPLQPRERDYAFAGSFYAFAIWIGLGVLPLISGLKRVLSGMPATVIASGAALILVPGVMAMENWDDHDRSHRTIARDIAFNYLNTVGENGIIFTNGDNDTFPLWYAQEVEGIRTDVRVTNLSYLQTDWYIDQMKRKAYESDPLPFSMEHDQYVLGKRDMVYVLDRIEGHVDLKEAIRFLASDNERTKRIPQYNRPIEHLPSTSFKVPADSAKIMEKEMVSERYAHLVRPELLFDLNKERILKNEMMVLDLLAHNDWERPMYYAVTVGAENYVGLQNYFQLEGFGFQIVPVPSVSKEGQHGRVDTDKMYDNVMNKFIFDGWNDPRVYLDENHQRMGINMRNNLSRLATALVEEGDFDKAVEVLDKTMSVLPADRIPHNYFSLAMAEAYYKAGETAKGDDITMRLADDNFQELNFFTNLKPSFRNNSMSDIQLSMAIYAEVLRVLRTNNRDEGIREVEGRYEGLFQKLGFFDN
jgi:hypothetical protein